LRSLTLDVYRRAEEIARERGIILADTKVEFGLDEAGVMTLGDEVLTPDSSRFWDAALWAPGQAQPSFDKQYVRNWLETKVSDGEWDKNPPGPILPTEIVEGTVARYREAAHRLFS
jgi:phosphoribosylaminoimidazole-succinocarboxamide synthase